MSAAPPEAPKNRFDPFDPETIVLRAAFLPSWFSADKLSGAPIAFYRRSPKTHKYPDTKGLSVDKSKDNIKAILKRRFHGFIKLEVQGVSLLGLQVERDGDTHGNITDGVINLPFRDDIDLTKNAESDRIAIALTEISKADPEDIPDEKSR